MTYVARVVAWESRVSKKTVPGAEASGVQIEVRFPPFSQFALHLIVGGAVWYEIIEPVGVRGIIGVGEGEGDAV